MNAEAASSTKREQARCLALAALERNATKVVALDVSRISSFADIFVLCTGSSSRNVRAIADALIETAKRRGFDLRGVEGYEEGSWVLIDLNDAIVHIFLGEKREHYDLDRLWSDAPFLYRAENEARGELGA